MENNTNINYLTCETSLAHTFGNITAFIADWLENRFPQGTFKTRHIHSKIAHAQMRSVSGEFLKKSKPMLIIRPRIDWDAKDEVFLANTLITQKQNDIYMSIDGSNLQEFIYDRNRHLSLKYQLNRIVVNFDVIMIFGTLIQQIDKMSYIQHRLNPDIPFFIHTALESYIPRAIVEELSSCAKVPIYDKDGNVKNFLTYLNGVSKDPITYKLKGSRNKDEFFRYYPAKIDTLISNLSADDGETVGQVKSNYQITFTMRCEFNTMGSLFLFSDYLDQNRILKIEDSDNLIPTFTDVILEEDFNLKDGWSLYKGPSVKLDKPYDKINIGGVLNLSIKEAIKYHLKNGIPLERFLIIKIREQGKLIEPPKYKINYETLDVFFNKCSTYYTYKILIMININYINNLIKNIYGLK